MGRKAFVINPTVVYDYARKGASASLIGRILGVDDEVINRRFRRQLEQGRAEYEMEILELQLTSARGGNASTLRWLGGNVLGQKEEVNVSSTTPQVISLSWADNTDAKPASGPVVSQKQPDPA